MLRGQQRGTLDASQPQLPLMMVRVMRMVVGMLTLLLVVVPMLLAMLLAMLMMLRVVLVALVLAQKDSGQEPDMLAKQETDRLVK